MKKIALIISASGSEWTGGLNYYSNLVVQCQKYASDRLKFTIITTPECKEKIRELFPEKTDVLAPRLLTRPLLRRIRNRIYSITGTDWVMRLLFKFHDITIVSHSQYRNYGKDIKIIGWIPDCQHRYLPSFFSEDELNHRDREFQSLLNYCDRLLVSSQVAYDDIRRFYQVPEGKLAILRFYKQPVFNQMFTTWENLLEKYQLPAQFLYLPNQFWAHKNHIVVINALKILEAEGINVTVVCSGNTHDYRNPGYFSELMQQIKHSGLHDQLKVIGLVPSEDVHALILYSMAMINPSLFEGWSTSVEEARANGKRIILSDIPVHREQSPPDALYFNPDSSTELAHRIKQVFSEFSELKEEQRKQQAKYNADQLSRQFAHEYAEIVKSQR